MSSNRFRRHALVAALALAGGGLPVCAATISGVAADRDGRPIKRVTVTIDSLQPSGGIYKTSSTTTDENGRYAFEDFEPGAYALHAQKEGWVSADRHITVSTQSGAEAVDVPFVMDLTFQNRVILNIHMGSAVYLLLFGLGVLAVNFLFVPEPSQGVSATAWGIIALSIVLAWAKLEPRPALELSLVGTAAAAMVHWYGRKVAERRLLEESRKTEARIQAQREEHERLESLVGQRGVTLTDLRACGTARLGDDVVQVRALSGYIPKGTEVVVTILDGRTPVVETADARV